jgi:hypothetical protein
MPHAGRNSKSTDEEELKALADELVAAASRMAASLDRAIAAARAALDPAREVATRKRFEREFAGKVAPFFASRD